MSTFYYDTKKCAVCGEEQEIKVWSSTSVSGYCDLDFRPPEHERSIIYLGIEKCEKCGFTWLDIKDEMSAKIYNMIKDSDSYKNCDGINFSNIKAENYYKAFLISKKIHNKEQSFSLIKRASWICDDIQDFKNAMKCRLKSIELLDKLIETNNENKEFYILIKLDFLRRCKKFYEVEYLFNQYKFTELEHQQICKFQKFLAKNKDSDVHTYNEVLNAFNL